MKTLADILGAPHQRDAVIADVVALIEQQVARRTGLGGIGLRTALGMVKAARPDLLQRAVTRLLPEFAAALEPLYRQFRNGHEDRDFSLFLQKHAVEARDALLATADRHVAALSNASLKSVYQRFRGTAEKEVEDAIAPLSRLIRGYLD